ncbi:hypothetical protein SAMN04488021_10878 [Paracoccus aminovorans]|uniref:DUF2332 domain-containing protein n=1 Tax=Paracoccus aminovorans TaxID=34004 RepID=A0A1I2ZGN7_9RHOB|nr:DUF2332 domain-containing protein [Paracoccus aminovorans]CQR86379.1 hypothetical protein JCM7685_1814 [Paracoccus aminovorans]SFH36271.1 hypothetical protein SAMN04488021_10878 [Paracoccus aminovorans]
MGWQEALAQQARACRALGSGLTARVCEALTRVIAADQGPVGRRVKAWPGDPRPAADSLPLRLCGALHALVLSEAAPELARAYATGGAADLDREVCQAVQMHGSHILDWIEHAPQTNEVGRSAVLIAGAWFVAGLLPGVRFDLLELGASAGLNLNFPRYSLADEDGFQPTLAGDPGSDLRLRPIWRGSPPPPAALPVGAARGVDLHPLDPARDGFRLMAYVWADQQDRLARLRAALAIAAAHPPQVDRADAADWLEARLAEPAPHGRLVYHTVAAQYFPSATRARIETALNRAGAQVDAARPLAHLAMENDGGDGAGLRLRLWDGTRPRAWDLGRADFHARWIDWRPREN